MSELFHIEYCVILQSSISTDLTVRDRDPCETDCVFDTSFLLYDDKTQ